MRSQSDESLSCSDPAIGGLLPSWIEGVLDEGARTEFEAHLLGCEACVRAAEESAGPVLPWLTESRLPEPSVPASPRNWTRFSTLLATWAAAAAALLVTTALVLSERPPPPVRDNVKNQAVAAEKLSALGRITAALPLAEAALRLAPDDLLVLARCGRVFLRGGQVERATKLLQRAVRQSTNPADPNTLIAYEDLVTALRRARRKDEARAVAEDFVRFVGGERSVPFPPTQEGVGGAVRLGMALRARAWVKVELYADIPGALADIRKVLDLCPKVDPCFPAQLALIDMMRIYSDYLEKPKETVELALKLRAMRLTARGEDGVVDRNQRANAYRDLGRALVLEYMSEDPDPALLLRARSEFELAVGSWADNARGMGWTLSDLALVRYLEGDIGRALEEYRTASRFKLDRGMEADRIQDEIQIAQILLVMDRPTDALSHARDALNSAREAGGPSGMARALLTLGMAQRAVGFGKDALANLDAAAKIAERYAIRAVMRRIRAQVEVVLATKHEEKAPPFFRL